MLSPPGSRHGEEAAALRAEDQRRANPGTTAAVLRQPDCVENATGHACSWAGSHGRTTYERQQQCEESGTTRSCSASISIGSIACAATDRQARTKRGLEKRRRPLYGLLKR